MPGKKESCASVGIAIRARAGGTKLFDICADKKPPPPHPSGDGPATCTRRRSPPMKKKVPKLKTDKAAEAFLVQDLSELDFSQFKPARFEFEKKDEQINMRVPRPLLAAVKARAKARGIPYTRFIRETLERAMSAPES